MAKARPRRARPQPQSFAPAMYDPSIVNGNGPQAACVAAEMPRRPPVELGDARMGVAQKNGLMRRPTTVKRGPSRPKKRTEK